MWFAVLVSFADLYSYQQMKLIVGGMGSSFNLSFRVYNIEWFFFLNSSSLLFFSFFFFLSDLIMIIFSKPFNCQTCKTMEDFNIINWEVQSSMERTKKYTVWLHSICGLQANAWHTCRTFTIQINMICFFT